MRQLKKFFIHLFLSVGSGVAVPGLSCSRACGIFPDQGSNLCLLNWEADSFPLSHQGSPLFPILIHILIQFHSLILSIFYRFDKATTIYWMFAMTRNHTRWFTWSFTMLYGRHVNYPRDGGARWAAVCGLTQSRTQLKRLSSSSSRRGNSDSGVLTACLKSRVY